jgi:hypothetical protein
MAVSVLVAADVGAELNRRTIGRAWRADELTS